MKGIILAAGKGTRLYPITKPVPKPLLPVYDKPMIYYPLSVMIQLGIEDILIIVPEDYADSFFNLLGYGSKLGVNIEYRVQYVPRGIADAFIVGEEFIGDDSVLLLLGDNIFFNKEVDTSLKYYFNRQVETNPNSAMVLGYKVRDPWRFGVVEFDDAGKVISLEEKPISPKSNYIVPGFYYYPNDVIQKAKQVTPSARGELEITSINQMYLSEDNLYVRVMPDSSHWFDTGTADSVSDAANSIRVYQRDYEYIGCIEIAAYEAGFIDLDDLEELGESLRFTNYGSHILDYCNNRRNLQI